MNQRHKTYNYSSTIPAESGYNLIVAGGGMAGVSAAVTAGRLGVKVLLLETTGCLGGMATNGLVTAFDGVGDGKRNIVGGIMLEIIEHLYKNNGLGKDVSPDTWRRDMYHPTKFNPEALKRLLDQLTQEANVTVRYFSTVIDVDADTNNGRVRGLVVKQPEGLRFLEAPFVIDASGHASILKAAGGAVREAGRDTQNIMPSTLCWLSTNLDNNPNADAEINKAIEAGTFPLAEYFAVPSRLGNGLVSFNAGHVYQMNSFNSEDLSKAMVRGRELAEIYNDWWRQNVPGAKDLTIVATAPLMGIRESRSAIGEYILTHDDFKKRKHIPDQIGVFNKEIDIHVYNDNTQTLNKHQNRSLDRSNTDYWMTEGETYGIPYGALVPKGWKNLWVPGRAISADVIIHGSVRVMPACCMTGQAAGAAAAQCLKTGETACSLNPAPLVKTLRSLGAYLPQEHLSIEITRSNIPTRNPV